MTTEFTVEHPLINRYSSSEMKKLYSDEFKFGSWRNFWVNYAEALMEVSNEKIATKEEVDDLRSKMSPKYIDWKIVKEIEKRKGHDVVAHVEHYRNQCPTGGRLVHLALTSRDVTDNVELYQLKKGLQNIHARSVNSLRVTARNVEKYRDVATVAQSHLQKADIITEGKRIAMWGNPLLMSIERLEYEIENFKGRGIEGAVGDRSQLTKLLDGNREAAKKVNEKVMQKMGFNGSFIAIGQQYPREYECMIFNPLSVQCANMHKVAEDICILQHDVEMEEPFSEEKVGSSAMGGKRNPNLSERMSGLSTYVNRQIELAWDATANAKLEGDVRDSAMRRMYHMETMLGMDALHTLYQTIMDGITVYDKVCMKNVMDSLAITSLQSIETEAGKRGGDKTLLHTRIRDLAMKDFESIRKEGKESRLIQNVKQDEMFSKYLKPEDIDAILVPSKRIEESQRICEEFVLASKKVLDRNKNIFPRLIKTQIELYYRIICLLICTRREILFLLFS